MEQTPLDLAVTGGMNAGLIEYVPPGARLVRQAPERRPLPDDEHEPDARLLVRVGSVGPYDDEQVRIYRDYVRCGGTLLLLSDAKAPGESDPVAAGFGITVGGAVQGEAIIDRFEAHPATRDAVPLRALGGTGILQTDEHARILGYLSHAGFLDRDGDAEEGADEGSDVPMVAIRHFGRGTAVFLGSTSIVSEPDHPLPRGLIQFLFPGTPWLRIDPGELEDSREHPRPLTLDGHTEELSLHGLDIDWFRVDVAAGDLVEVRVVSECEPAVNVWEPERSWPPVVSNRNAPKEDGGSVRFTAPQIGHYIVEVSSLGRGVCERYAISGVLVSEGERTLPQIETPAQLP